MCRGPKQIWFTSRQGDNCRCERSLHEAKQKQQNPFGQQLVPSQHDQLTWTNGLPYGGKQMINQPTLNGPPIEGKQKKKLTRFNTKRSPRRTRTKIYLVYISRRKKKKKHSTLHTEQNSNEGFDQEVFIYRGFVWVGGWSLYSD